MTDEICLVVALAMGAPEVAAQEVKTTEGRMQLTLDGTAARTFPLFGPKQESEWAPAWKPRFLQPTDGSQTADGAVFLTSGSHGDAVWTMTRYDEIVGAVDDVRVKPGRLVTRISIRVRPAGAKSTVTVVYKLTSLGADGDHLIDDFNTSFPAENAHWEESINHLLETGQAFDPQRRPGPPR